MQDSSLFYVSQIKVRSQIIYITTIVFVFGIMALLPFITVDVSVKSNGLLQSELENAELRVPVSGRLIKLNFKDNQKVQTGDTLLAVDPSVTRQQSSLLTGRTKLIEQLLTDLAIMTVNADPEHALKQDLKLQTGQYQATWQQLCQQLQNTQLKLEQVTKTFDRYDHLHRNKVISDSEIEKHRLEKEQTEAQYQFIVKQYRAQWQTEANQYRQEQRELESRKADLREQNRLYTLKAPVTGSVQNLSGLQEGAYVFANQKIADISPDSSVVAVCYVSPADIGFIRDRQQVRLQIDAFNYNQWGIMGAKVIDISDDILVRQDQSPVFKVKCKLKGNFLQLKSGYKGFIKKGMTFNARFIVAKRTLWQLLYDKVDNWVNPSR